MCTATLCPSAPFISALSRFFPRPRQQPRNLHTSLQPAPPLGPVLSPLYSLQPKAASPLTWPTLCPLSQPPRRPQLCKRLALLPFTSGRSQGTPQPPLPLVKSQQPPSNCRSSSFCSERQQALPPSPISVPPLPKTLHHHPYNINPLHPPPDQQKTPTPSLFSQKSAATPFASFSCRLQGAAFCNQLVALLSCSSLCSASPRTPLHPQHLRPSISAPNQQ